MKRIWRFFAFVWITCQVAMAQNAQLSGLVKDKTGAVIPQARVTLRNGDTGNVIRANTDKAGFFIYSSVEPGKYILSAEASGFDETVIPRIKLDTAANVSQDVVLQVKKSAQEVTVTQQAGLTTENGTVSTVIDRTLIENMPLNGKDLTTLFELSPGAILNAGGSPTAGGGFSVNGQRPTANYLTVDGATGNSFIPVNPGTGQGQTGTGIATSASGGTNGMLPIDAIEEYRMDTSTYTAENGRTPGGQIQVRTRSGTNQFHGTLFENFRNQVLDATDWFVKYSGLKQSQLRMNDFGGTAGGPILKNRLFFFVANDNLVLDQPVTAVQQNVPNTSLRQQAYPAYQTFMAAFPVGNGGPNPTEPGFDFYNLSYPDLIRDHTTSVRLDGQLPRSIHAFFRSNTAPSTQYAANTTNGYGYKIDINTYTGGLSVPLAAHIIDELTVNQTSNNTQYVTFSPPVGGNNPNAVKDNLPMGVNPSADFFWFGIFSSDNGAYSIAETGPQNLNQLHQWNVVDSLSLQFGRHALKFGGDFLTRQTTIRNYNNVYEVDVNLEQTPPYTHLGTGLISSLFYVHVNSDANVSIANTSLFANDDWKLSRNLTLNAGIRWEYNPPPSVGPLGTLALQGTSLAPASLQAAVSTNPLYNARHDNFAPRLGFAWSPRTDQNASTVVRGGIGIYFDTGQAATAAGVAASGFPYRSSQTYTNPGAYSSINWTGLSATQAAEFPVSFLYLIDPNLLCPRTFEWSLTVEQQFGKDTRLSTSYVANDGEKLAGQDRYYNAKNSAGQYPISTGLVSANGSVYILTNQSHSNYQALQVQLTSQMGQRLSALASYTWGHAEDNGSTDFTSVGALALNPLSDSANDIRHTFATAIHYAPAGISGNWLLRSVTQGWGVDTIARLQTASPFTVIVSNSNPGAFLSNADAVPGQPVYLHEHVDSYGKVVPGNKLLNHAVFSAPPKDASGNFLRQGNTATNGYRLFGLAQWDLAVDRTWKIWEQLNLNCRVDAFNILNTANFAQPSTVWASSNDNTFGRAQNTYSGAYGGAANNSATTGAQLAVFQNGGPRELQLSLKLKF